MTDDMKAREVRIPVSTAERIAKDHNLRQVLVIGYDGDLVHVTTYGKTKAECAAAAKAQDFWAGKIREFSFRGSNYTDQQAEIERLQQRVAYLEDKTHYLSLVLADTEAQRDALAQGKEEGE